MDSEKKCLFANGCPFKGCTKETIVDKLQELRKDPVWEFFLKKMDGCPLYKKCPISST